MVWISNLSIFWHPLAFLTKVAVTIEQIKDGNITSYGMNSSQASRKQNNSTHKRWLNDCFHLLHVGQVYWRDPVDLSFNFHKFQFWKVFSEAIKVFQQSKLMQKVTEDKTARTVSFRKRVLIFFINWRKEKKR